MSSAPEIGTASKPFTEADWIAYVISTVGLAGAALSVQGRAGGLADLIWVVGEGLRRHALGLHPLHDLPEFDPSKDPAFCMSFPPGMEEVGRAWQMQSYVPEVPMQHEIPHPAQWQRR